MRPQPAADFDWIDTAAGLALRCRALEPFADQLFTTRAWLLGSSNGPEADRAPGWSQVAKALGGDPAMMTRVKQVHGSSVHVVRREDTVDDPLAEADIIVTDDPQRAVAIQTADCVPMLIADTKTGAVAAAHAGWRGLAARVPDVAVAALAHHFGGRARDLVVAVGPAISAARYEVGRDVRDRFEHAGFAASQIARWFPSETREGHWLFDGWSSASDQLEAAGVPRDRIHVAKLCTATHPDLLCSYRRDGARAGRMAAAIRARVRT
jgi:polyphenol oxidase